MKKPLSLTLFKLTLKKNWKLFVIFFGVLTMYSSVMISMYDPENMQAITAMTEMFPPKLMEAMNFSSGFSDLTGYLASWLYGLLMIGFPLVYSIILGNGLVAREVDSGSIVCLLTTPDSRVTIILTKALYAVLSMVVLMASICILNMIISQAVFPEYFDSDAFLQLNVTVGLANILALSISFFFSSLFNTTRCSLAFGAGIPVMFILFNMLGGASDQAEILKKISIYGWYDPLEIVGGAETAQINLIYIGLIAALLIASVLIFKNKRLPV